VKILLQGIFIAASKKSLLNFLCHFHRNKIETLAKQCNVYTTAEELTTIRLTIGGWSK